MFALRTITARISRTATPAVVAVCLAVGLAGCSNAGFKYGNKAKSTNGQNLNTTNEVKLTISNVTVTAPQGAQNYQVSIFMSSQSSAPPLTDFCNLAGGANACVCRAAWVETNTQGGAVAAINRVVDMPLTQVQGFFASCNAFPAYANEVADGTTIQFSVVPYVGNLSGIKMTPFAYLKGEASQVPSGGGFFDDQGRPFNNIHRYSCYDSFYRGRKITSKVRRLTHPNDEGTYKDGASSTMFCKDGDNQSGEQECLGHWSPKVPSSQSYYYNLYIKSAQLGGVNPENESFVCPRVQEPLVSGGGTVGWPLDSTFALSQVKSSDFSVPVEAASVLGNSDPGSNSSTHESCNTDPNAQPPAGGDMNNSIAFKCLGWAKKPNPNGTCPTFKDSTGVTRQTYRLRRYFAVYPFRFKTGGHFKRRQAPSVDTIYVLDRPVNSGDPLNPYTMAGPKPCPFAYFDQTGLFGNNGSTMAQAGVYGFSQNNRPSYRGTNFSGWDGKNVDGTKFPNLDRKRPAPESVFSCAATLPIIAYDVNGNPLALTFGTSHSTNDQVIETGGSDIAMSDVFIRGVKPWSPHYEEDLSFEGCAAESNPFRDAPLHFAKDSSGNVSWCAEAYPTQNSSPKIIDRRMGALTGDVSPSQVKNFTSHVVKNSDSPACSATIPPDLEFPPAYPASSSPPNGTTLGSIPGYPVGNVTNPCGAANPNTCGVARHPSWVRADEGLGFPATGANRTCDRTVLDPGANRTKFYPLLAEPHDVEQALVTDKSYNCVVTYDNNHGKQGTTTPSTGCCSPTRVFLNTGGVVQPTDRAHLEPNRACLVPNY